MKAVKCSTDSSPLTESSENFKKTTYDNSSDHKVKFAYVFRSKIPFKQYNKEMWYIKNSWVYFGKI